jgi:hypothetical protein
MYEYRCDERLKDKTEGSTRLGYTDGWVCDLETIGVEVWGERRATEVEDLQF